MRGNLGFSGELAQAISTDLAELAGLHSAEPTAPLLQRLRAMHFPASLGLCLSAPKSQTAVQTLQRGLTGLPMNLDQITIDTLAADYADIYLNFTLRTAPCESVWLDDEHLACQEAMFEVRECYKRHDLRSSNWRKMPDDHLAVQLEFLAFLFSGEIAQMRLEEIAQFLDLHLLRWIGDFAAGVSARCATNYFAGLALLTEAYCLELRALIQYLADIKPTLIAVKPSDSTGPLVQIGIPAYAPGLEPGW